MSISDSNIIVFAVVDKLGVVARSKSVVGEAEHMLDTGIGALDLDSTGKDTGTSVAGIVDEGSDRQVGVVDRNRNINSVTIHDLLFIGNRIIVVLDIALGDKGGLGGILDIGNGAVSILQLIDLVALEAIENIVRMELVFVVSVAVGDGGRSLDIGLAVVVGTGVVISEIEDNLVLEFLSGERGSIGAIKNFEAVLEEALTDIIDLTEQLDRRPSVAGGGLSERNTNGDIVQSTGFQGEGTSGLHETTVGRSVTGRNLVPIIRIDGGFGTICAPMPRIAVVGEHEVAIEVGRTSEITVTTKLHALIVFPTTGKIVVVVASLRRLTVVTSGVVIIHEAAHTETLVVDNVVAEVDAIDSAVSDDVTGNKIPTLDIQSEEVVGMVGDVDSVINLTAIGVERVDIGALLLHLILVEELADRLIGRTREDISNVNLGVVFAIGIHVGALEEVDTDCRGDAGVATGTGAIAFIAVVAVAETTTDIAADEVVMCVTQIGVHPLAEIGFLQLIGGAVDNLVGVEGHVVDTVVGGEGESLSTDFKTDRLTVGFGMDVTHIVEDPPNGLVALQHLVGENTASDDLLLGFHRGDGDIGALRETLLDGARAEVVVEVVVRIVAIVGIVDTVIVSIIERSKVAGEVFTAVALGRPIEDNLSEVFTGIADHGNRMVSVLVNGILKVIHEGENLSLGDDVVLVIIVTDGKVDRGRTVDFQRAGPVVITFRTETESGNTQLGVDVITTNPQSGAEHGARVAGLGQMVLSDTAVVPHVAVAIDKGTDVVDVQLSGTLCTLTCSSLGLNSSVSRVGFLALDALACRDCRRESDK